MRYYVYELVILPDQKVCYVGKGHGDRLNDHLRRAKRPECKSGQKRLYRKLREVMATGRTIIGRVIYETEDETEALNVEANRIRFYGFENLFNVASHAFLGRVLKPEVRDDIAAAARRMWSDPAYRAKNHTCHGRKFVYRSKLKLRKPKNYPRGKFGKGVSEWCVLGKPIRYQVRFSQHGNNRSLGYFKTAIDAQRVYDDESERLYGSRPNNTSRSVE